MTFFFPMSQKQLRSKGLGLGPTTLRTSHMVFRPHSLGDTRTKTAPSSIKAADGITQLWSHTFTDLSQLIKIVAQHFFLTNKRNSSWFSDLLFLSNCECVCTASWDLLSTSRITNGTTRAWFQLCRVRWVMLDTHTFITESFLFLKKVKYRLNFPWRYAG